MFTRNNKNVPPFLFAKIGVFPPFFLIVDVQHQNIFRDQQSELKKGLKPKFYFPHGNKYRSQMAKEYSTGQFAPIK